MCVFCDIAAGDVPATIVFEDDATLAFLDIRPLFPGHVLVVPKEHIETLAELPPGAIAPFFVNVQKMAIAVEAAMDAKGTFVAINNKVSQSVSHLHVHVVPRRPKDGLRGFFWPRHRYGDEAHIEAAASSIREALAS